MAIPKKVEQFLAKHGIEAEIVRHKTVYTVYDLAQTLREKFEHITKTLLVKADARYILVVLPSNYRLDIPKFKKAIKAKRVSLASEKEMRSKFKTKPGAMLAFGPLHKLDVVADRSLLSMKQALFGAGDFTESLRIKIKEYLSAVNPKIERIATKIPLKLAVVPTPKKKKMSRRPAKRSGKRTVKPAKRKKR